MSTAERNAELARRVVADPRWATVVARDATADGQLRLFRAHDRRVLPPVLRVAARAPGERPVSCDARGRRARRFPALQALPSGSSESDRAARRYRSRAPAARSRPRSACRRWQSLAAEAGMSAWHFHRVFKAVTGLTPRAIRAGASRPPCAPGAHPRGQRHRCDLRGGLQLERAVLCGGQCASRHDAVRVPRRAARQHGSALPSANARLGRSWSPRASVASARSCLATIRIRLGRRLQDEFPKAELVGGDEDFERLVARVVGFVETPALGLDLPLDVRGTAFQQRVWQALRAVPAGTTASYTRDRTAYRRAARRSRRRAGLRRKPACGSDSLSSRRAERRRAVGLPLGCTPQGGTPGRRGPVSPGVGKPHVVGAAPAPRKPRNSLAFVLARPASAGPPVGRPLAWRGGQGWLAPSTIGGPGGRAAARHRGSKLIDPALNPGMPRVYLKTFGCQMNEYDSARMADVLRESGGYEPTEVARGGGPAAAQHLLGAREGAGEGVLAARAVARDQDATTRRDHRRRRLRREPGRRRASPSARPSSISSSDRRRCTGCPR